MTLRATFERFKARYVVKGYMQREGIDFNEVFAPTSKHTTFRALVSIVASNNLELHQLDIKTAFLNGDIDEDIYITQPPGYEQGGSGLVCYLKKSLYGLRQAPRAWHIKLDGQLTELGATASDSDPGLYTIVINSELVYLLIFVDDILIAAPNTASINVFKEKIMSKFNARDLGEARMFIGIEIARDRSTGSLTLSQSRMVNDLVKKFGFGDAKPKSTPFVTSLKLSKDDDNPLDTSLYPYAELVGALLYLMVCTRPDIAQAVGVLSRYMSKPAISHWIAAKGVLRYLAGTSTLGITYGSGDNTLIGYADADYAGDIDTRRSTTGYVFTLNGGVVSWSSRLQPTVAVSTTEAEYMAAAFAVKEALWLRKLINDFNYPVDTITIFADNQSALKILKHPIASLRSKHIDVIYHFARERVNLGDVKFEYVPSEGNISDIMTKPLSENKFSSFKIDMGMVT